MNLPPRELPGTRALTICQPSAWAICAGLKDVENRRWATRLRGHFLVHAGLTRDLAVEGWMRRQGIDVPEELPQGAIIGRAILVGCERPIRAGALGLWARAGAGGGYTMWHWLLAGAEEIGEPVAARGQLNFWRPSPASLALVAEQG